MTVKIFYKLYPINSKKSFYFLQLPKVIIFIFELNYRETGVTGKILVNGKNRSTNSQTFRGLSAYIHQEDALRPYLTVGEAMSVATNLKLGYNVTKEYKSDLVSVFFSLYYQQYLGIGIIVYTLPIKLKCMLTTFFFLFDIDKKNTNIIGTR